MSVGYVPRILITLLILAGVAHLPPARAEEP